MDNYRNKSIETDDPTRTIAKLPGAAVIDSSAITNLITILGKDAVNLLPQLINVYIDDAGRLQAAAEDAIKKDRRDDLRRAAHTLKSTSANLGATALSSLCNELEMLARSGEIHGSEELLSKIKTEFERVRADLRKIAHGTT